MSMKKIASIVLLSGAIVTLSACDRDNAATSPTTTATDNTTAAATTTGSAYPDAAGNPNQQTNRTSNQASSS